VETYPAVHNKVNKSRDKRGFEQSVQLVEEPGLSMGRDLAVSTDRARGVATRSKGEHETSLPIRDGLFPLLLSIGGVNGGRVS